MTKRRAHKQDMRHSEPGTASRTERVFPEDQPGERRKLELATAEFLFLLQREQAAAGEPARTPTRGRAA